MKKFLVLSVIFAVSHNAMAETKKCDVKGDKNVCGNTVGRDLNIYGITDETMQMTLEKRKVDADEINAPASSIQAEKIIGFIIFLVLMLGIFKLPDKPNKRKQEENEQDKRNLISILESINTNDIDSIIEYAEGGMPQLCMNLISYYDITLEGLIVSSTFHFYNSELEKIIMDFCTFHRSLYSHHSKFIDTANNNLFRFPKSHEHGWNDVKLKNYEKEFRSDVGKLKAALKKLINYVIDNYPDINRQATNSKAIAARKKLDNYFA